MRFLIQTVIGCTLAIVSSLGLLAQDEVPRDQPNGDAIAAKTEDRKPSAATLSIGSKAPKLSVDHWLHENRGKPFLGEEFEAGKVYVIEFWATWCGPCISAMPHIAELQSVYANQGVSMISVTDERLKTVDQFLERNLRSTGNNGGKPKTFRELTSAYHLACDPDGSMMKDYMEAANRNGIPCAFLIGKQGLIEWIGHPMLVDEPLGKVVTDSWNREEFVRVYAARQRANDLLTEVSRHMRSSDTKSAVEAIDGFLASAPPRAESQRFKMIKFQVLANDNAYFDEASQYALKLLTEDGYDAESANDFTWTIYELAESGDFENQEVLKAALALANRGTEMAGPSLKPYIMDTVAHLELFTGDHKGALETQRKAYEIANDDQKPKLIDFLKELEIIVKPIGRAIE